jgi:hypothetical protein
MKPKSKDEFKPKSKDEFEPKLKDNFNSKKWWTKWVLNMIFSKSKNFFI